MKKRERIGEEMIFGIITAIVLGIAAVSYYAYRTAFRFVDRRTNEQRWAIPDAEQYQKHKDYMESLIKEMADLPCEWVSIRSFDGTELWGRYYHVSEHAPLQIQMHGYQSDGIRDFCGGNKAARQMGMNTLVVDQRAHGRSGGHTLTFGVKERRDCLEWVKYVNERLGTETPVFLVGLSMGAATVLMASELDLPENVVGIIADCPYSSQKQIICNVGNYMKLPMKILYPFVELGAFLFGHFRISETSPVEAVRKAKVPVLLIHGEDDRFVPCEMSRKLYTACASKATLVTVPEAGHGISYILDTEKYERAVETFVGECLKGQGISQ